MQKTNISVFLLILTLLFVFPPDFRAQEISPPKQLDKEYRSILRLIGQQRYDEAIQALEQIIYRDSSFYRAYLKLAEVHTYNHSLPKAQSFFANIIRANPENSYAHHALGLVYRKLLKYGEAYNHILKALQLNPEYEAAYPDFVSVNGKLEWAEKTFRELVDARPDIAAGHYGLAYLYSLQLRYEEQYDAAKKALALRPELAAARLLIADYYYSTGRYAETLEECNAQLTVAKERGDVEYRLEFLKLKAFATNRLGDSIGAIRLLNEMLRVTQEIGDKDKESDSFNSLTRIYWYSTNYRLAMASAKRALAIEQALGDKRGQASNLNYLGISHAELGDYSRALEYYEHAGRIYSEIGKTASAAICTGNIASLYIKLGDETKALSHFEQSLEALQGLGSGWEKPKATYYGEMGVAYERLGNFNEALNRYDQALQILRPLKTEGHQVSRFLAKIGNVHRMLGDTEQAMQYYQQALNTNMRIFDKSSRATNLLHIGRFYYGIDEYEKAEALYHEALDIGAETESVAVAWQAKAGLAGISRKRGDLLSSLQYYRRAIEDLESIRGKLRLEEEKAEFIKDRIRVYVGIVDLLAQLHLLDNQRGYDSEAFLYAERAKARALIDVVQQGKVFSNLEEIPADFRQAHLAAEKELEGKHTELSNLLTKPDKDSKAIASLKHQIEMLQHQKSSLLDDIREKYPQYYQLANPEIFTAETVQQKILKPSQALIEYFVGEEKIFVWMMTSDHFRFHTIDIGRDELQERLARISPLFQKGKKQLFTKIDHRWANVSGMHLRELWQTLMLEPFGDLLTPGLELIVVPDDILFYFPFEILVTDRTSDEMHFLIEKHPIAYSPSASLLDPGLRKQNRPTQDLLAFGNPDFGRPQSQGIISWVSSLLRAGSVLRSNRFEQLPYAELEVNSIADNFSEAAIFTGEKATEAKLKNIAGDYRFIHLATHNLTDSRQPMYSKIILAQTESQQEDGFLQTYEVYNMRLNADLVVLSGCNTGLGKLSRGEGLIGMTRAFFYAGASSLVVSLWPVNDKSTSELMKYFYQNMKDGMSEHRALQKAKMKLIRSNDWKRDPFYWGAFVLLGGEN